MRPLSFYMKPGDKLDLLPFARTQILADDQKMTALELAPPSAGEMQQLADDLYWIRFTLPFRLNHINLFAFDTNEGWLLLDCGIKGDATASQWQALLDGPLAGLPVSGTRKSHYHADHVGYAGALAVTAQSIWALLNMNRRNGGLQNDTEYGAIIAAAYQRFGLADAHVTAARDTGNYYSFCW